MKQNENVKTKALLFRALFCSAGIALSLSAVGCASISEDQCVAGNWSDLGYRDGNKGTARDRIAKYVEKCGKYGQAVDRQAYLSSYETGLSHYCVYDKGFALGEQGSQYNAVCGDLANDFRVGFEDGRAEYELRRRYDRYESDLDGLDDEITDIANRIADPALIDTKEKARLIKKEKRLKRERKNMQWDFRQFRRDNQLG